MSALDVLDEKSLHGHGMFAGVAREIAAVAKQRAAAAPKEAKNIASATMFAFDKLLRKHLVRSGQTAPVDAAWGGASALVNAVKDTFEASDEQTALLNDLLRLINAQNTVKLQSDVTSARMKEEFPIDEELAKAMLPAPKGKKREQEGEDFDSELVEEDFSFDFDIKMPKLFHQMKKLKADVAPALELSARVDTLEREHINVINKINEIGNRQDLLKLQFDDLLKRIEKLEKEKKK